jgi:hypothetical protein
MKTYNLFVSHAWKYSDDYKKVVEWLDRAKAEKRLDFNNYSDPKDDPIVAPDEATKKSRMKEKLRNQIRPSTIVIVISGMYVAHSEWIDFEIDTAVEMGKYIIGLNPWGQERIPTKVTDNANVMVGWNYDSLIGAILSSE